jgi:hypothetical protein
LRIRCNEQSKHGRQLMRSTSVMKPQARSTDSKESRDKFLTFKSGFSLRT